MRKGVTLVEVITGALILAIAFGGLLATFVSVRRYVKRANKRLIAANLVSQTLSDLYRAVREDTWDSGTLQDTGAGSADMDEYIIDGQLYEDLTSPTPNSYTVTTVGDYRRVSVTVNYP